MTTRRRVALIVLEEDSQHHCFAQGFLGTCGINSRDIRHDKVGGKGHLHAPFVKWIKAIRSRKDKCALIIIRDADGEAPDKIRNEFSEKLEKAGQPPLGLNDPVIMILPNRTIEHWVHYLQGKDYDETDSAPKFDDIGSTRNDAKSFGLICSAKADKLGNRFHHLYKRRA